MRSLTRFHLLLMFLLGCLPLISFGQQMVSGRVTDAAGKPLPQATVVVQGKKQGAVTGKDGRFTTAAVAGDTLIITAVGFERTKVAATSTPIMVTLAAGLYQLENVVVVGYQSVKKTDLTASVATVEGKELNQRISTNNASLLQGKLPGLQVVQGSGEPGAEGVSLVVRGVGTFSNANVSPLVIVDGLPGNLNSINQNDIASVSVLKDAAAASIYGSRGANGVIVVTTKKGSAGKTAISYGFSLGVVNPVKLPRVITNSADYMTLYNQAAANSGRPAIFTDATIQAYRNATDKVEYPNFDWLGALFRPALVKTHNLNMTGGSEKTTYNFSLGATDQPGTMIGFGYQKYLLGAGISAKVSKRITFGTNLQLRFDKKFNPGNGAGDMFLSALAQSPLYAPERDGKYIFRAYSSAEPGNKNPIAVVDNKYQTRLQNYYAQGNVNLAVDIIDGLKWETRGGFNYYSGESKTFRPSVPLYFYHNINGASPRDLDVGSPGLDAQKDGEIYASAYTQLNFNRQFGDHNISALAGLQQEYDRYSILTGYRTGYPTNLLSELNAGSSDGQTNSGTGYEWAIRSQYGNVNYNYNAKYYAGASIRRDGSSRFSPDNRYGTFYSVSGAWRISNENFMKRQSFIDDLKLRGSWGTLGNQNIGNYPYQSLLSGSNYVFGNSLNTGFAVTSLVDPGITWEKTRTFGVGLDLAALDNRLSVTVDWFDKLTTAILRGAQVPLWLGLDAPVINNGSLKNRGWEVSVKWQDKINKDWNYYVSANAQAYKNQLVNYGTRDIGGNTIRENGHELDQWYLYVWDGIFQSQDDIAKSPTQDKNPKPGTLKMKDVNGDGKITPDDRTYVSGRYPKMQYSFSFGFSWKDLDFSAQLYGSYGQKILVSGWGAEPFRQGSVPTVDWLTDAWTPTNHSNTKPMVYIADGFDAITGWGNSTYFLKDASFLRLRAAQIGYTLHINALERYGFRNLRLYAMGDNLLTFSKYPGLDPERTGSGGRYVTYPQVRTFTFGANVQF